MTLPTVPLRVAPPLLFGSRRSLRLIERNLYVYRHGWLVKLYLADAPGSGLSGRALCHVDEAAILLLPVVPAQVPKSSVSLVPPRLPAAVGRNGVPGPDIAHARRLGGETGHAGFHRMSRGQVPPRYSLPL